MCTYKIYKNPSGGRTSKASFSRRNIIHKYLMRATMHSPIFVLHPGISVLPDNMLVQDNTLFLPALDTSALAILFLESSCQQATLSYHHPMRSFQNRTLFSSSPEPKYLPNIQKLLYCDVQLHFSALQNRSVCHNPKVPVCHSKPAFLRSPAIQQKPPFVH